jgi:hypothetical protein
MQSVSAWQYYVGLLILAVFLAVAAVKSYQMWEELHDVEEPDSPSDLLETFEEAHAAGEIDDEELERVRHRLQSAPSQSGAIVAPTPPEPEKTQPDRVDGPEP